MKHWSLMIVAAGMGIAAMPAFGANPAHPGTLNYVEGAVYVDGKPVNNQDVGNVELGRGGVLSTGAGRAEILMTPGIFLRVDSNSAVRMISPDLDLTQVSLERGRAGVEVDQIFPQNKVQVVDAGVNTQLLKTGYYEFDANRPEAMVFEGKAEVVMQGGVSEDVKSHHELALEAGEGKQKTASFNPHPEDDELYNWSSLRSRYLAEANNQIAAEYGAPGFYPGWYWDPYMYGYTYLGWDPFLSPFGWGFYPWGGWGGFYGRVWYGGGPRFYGGGPRFGGGFRGGFGGRGGR